MSRPLLLALVVSLAVAAGAPVDAQRAPRARDLGVPFEGSPGALNAITDVAGIEVGFTTLISGEGKLVEGKGPIRTGVTAILPRNAMVAGRTMTGINGNTIYALPHDQLRTVLQKYGRLNTR